MWFFFCLACARSHARVSDGLVRCLFVWYFPFCFSSFVFASPFFYLRDFRSGMKKSHTQSRWNCVDLLGSSALYPAVSMNDRRKNENNSRLLVWTKRFIFIARKTHNGPKMKRTNVSKWIVIFCLCHEWRNQMGRSKLIRSLVFNANCRVSRPRLIVPDKITFLH